MFVLYVIILPGQQPHDLLSILEPEQTFPPQVGKGLLQLLVHLIVRPHPHGTQAHALHPPSTAK